jgi:hypothetical protein
MPARKPIKKSSVKKPVKPVLVPLYAVPIYNAIARGDLQEMRKLAVQGRKHIKDVQSALAALEKKLK